MSVMRIMTHSGQNVTVFCLNGEPIFFEVEKKVIPTVYTLWKFPDMLLSFTTWPLVLDKLKGGADLMLPGVILPSDGLSGLGRFEKGTLCSVCLKGNRAPVAVGTTLVSSRDLLEDGLRGKGVMIFHVYLDLLWAQGSKTQLPQLDILEDKVTTDEMNDCMQELSVDETEKIDHMELQTENTCTDRFVVQEDAENEHESCLEQNHEINAISSSPASTKDEEQSGEETLSLDPEDNTKSQDTLFENMDDLLEYCFFCALLRMKKVELPVLTSTFSRSYILPSCPKGKSVDIKKSSHKKLSKFLQFMQERGLISVQEASKGVDHITAIAWDHPELKDFKARKPVVESGAEVADSSSPCDTQPPRIEELFSVQVVGKYSEGKEGSSDNDDSDEDEKDGVFEDSGSEGDVEGELPSDSVSGTELGPENQTVSDKDSENAPVVSITPPSPGVLSPAGLENGQLEGENTVESGATDTQPPAKSTSPHLQLKSLLKSPGALRRKMAAKESPAPKEKKDLSSDLEEEGTASEFHEDEHANVPVKCLCDTHLNKEIVNEEFPISVDTLYEYLFTEADFYKRVQKARQTKDLVFNPWETTEDGQRRTLTYTVSINHAIGPKHSPTTEQQHCFQGSVPGKLYVIQTEINNEGIPYGDSFYITNRYCMTRTSNMTSRLRVSSEVTYQKSVWGFVRNMIEKNALEGLEGYFQFLVESLRRETTEGQWPKKRKTSPTRRHKRNRSLKNKEVTEPDMEVSNEDKTGLLERLSSTGAISRLVGVRSYLPQVAVANPLAVLVTILLGALLLLNVVLVYRLVLLEHATQTGIHWDGTIKDLPADAQQWAKLLQQQKHVQEVEMRRWRDVLASSIQLMNQVQQSLDLLQAELGKEQTTAAAEAT